MPVIFTWCVSHLNRKVVLLTLAKDKTEQFYPASFASALPDIPIVRGQPSRISLVLAHTAASPDCSGIPAPCPGAFPGTSATSAGWTRAIPLGSKSLPFRVANAA